MRLLPESNGVYRVNTRKKLKPFDIVKIIVASLLILVVVGMLYQKIHDFATNENLKYRYDYTRVNDKKMDYVLSGSGDYTVVFDGDIGGDLTQWITLSKTLNDNGIRTFAYNRQGYGYSDNGEKLTPLQQAESLKILLRKAGVTGKFILVGEGYGSLVMTNFAKLYPDSIEAMILVNPINESVLATDEIKKEYRVEKIRRLIEKVGSNIGLTNLLDKLGLTVELNGYEEKIPELFQEEFNAHRTMSSYTSAVYNELNNILDGTSDSQVDNLLGGKPYYLITNNLNDELGKLSISDNTIVHESSNKKFMSVNDSESILNAITHITKELNLIAKSSR